MWLFLFLFCGLAIAHPSLAKQRFYSLAGTINNNLKVRMALLQTAVETNGPQYVNGYYHYLSQQAALGLRGELRGDQLRIEEYNPTTHEKTGSFEGRLTATGFVGTWFSPSKTRSFPFALQFEASKTPWAEYYTYPDPTTKLADANVYFTAGAWLLSVNGRSYFQLVVGTQNCNGMLDLSPVTWQNATQGKVVVAPNNCTVEIEKKPDGLRFTERSYCAHHGAGCSFDGTAYRVKPTTPPVSQDAPTSEPVPTAEPVSNPEPFRNRYRPR